MNNASGNHPIQNQPHPDPMYKGNALKSRYRVLVVYKPEPPSQVSDEITIGFENQAAADQFADRQRKLDIVISASVKGPAAPLKEEQFT